MGRRGVFSGIFFVKAGYARCPDPPGSPLSVSDFVRLWWRVHERADR